MSSVVQERSRLGPAYWRGLAVRTVAWTVVVVTAMTAGQVLVLTFGIEQPLFVLAVGCAAAVAAGLTALAAIGCRERWAIAAVTGMWAVLLSVSVARDGVSGITLLVEAVGELGLYVLLLLAARDAGRTLVAKFRGQRWPA